MSIAPASDGRRPGRRHDRVFLRLFQSVDLSRLPQHPADGAGPGAPIRWRPILVGGVFNTVNPTVYANRAQPVPSKARYMLKDLRDWAAEAGLVIGMPPTVFPVNSVKAMRACVLLEPEGKLVGLRPRDVRGLLGRRRGHLPGRGDRGGL